VIDISFLLIGKPYSFICEDRKNQLYDYSNQINPTLRIGRIADKNGHSRRTWLLFTSVTVTVADEFLLHTDSMRSESHADCDGLE
jgi:hypothetical protein